MVRRGVIGDVVILAGVMVAVSVLQGCSETEETTAVKDTLLDEYFCGIYYPTDHASQGLPPCEDVRAAVVSNQTGGPLPTLELGDPAKPGLFFLHGWPDNAAGFAAQFGAFCFGPDAKYRCVAVTWQNFHPDLPAAPEADLTLLKTIELVTAAVEAANLVDPTFVIHDWGSYLGYNIMARQPALFRRTISFDIGTGGSPNKTYQVVNAKAYQDQNTPLTQSSAEYWSAPCQECATWQAAWPYVASMSFNGWIPQDMPGDKPLLFVWGNETRGKPREEDSLFFDENWTDFVESTPNGKVVESWGDHWFFHQHPKFVNTVILDWLESLPATDTAEVN